MAGRWVCVGYLAVPIGIWIWHGTRTWVRIHPIAARASYVNVGIVAPAVAVILENMPARGIGKEPSLIPARGIHISSILSIEHAARIPHIKPDIACS